MTSAPMAAKLYMEAAAAAVDRGTYGRTRYAGCLPYLDEILVAEIRRLRARIAELEDYRVRENSQRPSR